MGRRLEANSQPTVSIMGTPPYLFKSLLMTTVGLPPESAGLSPRLVGLGAARAGGAGASDSSESLLSLLSNVAAIDTNNAFYHC